MTTAIKLFEDGLSWLKNNYSNHQFFKERDIVWLLQTYLIKCIRDENLPYKIFNDFAIDMSKRIYIDLVICNQKDDIDKQGNLLKDKVLELAVEFKYEPDHKRGGNGGDIPAKKFPVVFWKEGILKDIERVKNIVNSGKSKAGYSIFIDEGDHFHKKHKLDIPLGSQWEDWSNDIWVLKYYESILR